MTEHELRDKQGDESPVGDVRRVREKLSEQFGNDVRRLAEYIREVGEQQGRELGCEVVRKQGEPVKPPRT